MAVKATGQKLQAFEASCEKLRGKLTGSVPVKHGQILVRLTDSGEEIRVDAAALAIRVSGAAGAPLIEVAGHSAVIKGTIAGKKRPSRAFAPAGIRGKGDLSNSEARPQALGRR